MIPDPELLRRFDRTNAEDAFAELVKRHVNLIYSAALRQVQGDEHLAKDVAQTVFSDLARKAGSLARRESLTGWLYTSTHHAAAKIIRTEIRRRDREEKFMRESEGSGTGIPPVQSADEQAEWENLRPMLDAAMHEIKESDREAILLRYFENRPFAEVGAKLGLNENAARMRVERALEKLRAVFAKRGIAATATLASVLSANAVQLAPAGLSVSLTTTAIATAGTGAFTFMKIMTMTKIKLGISALAVAGAATALVVQHQTQTKLRDENGLMQQQIAQLQTDNESFSNRLATAGDAKKLSDDQFNELLKLRGEVGVLRRLTNGLGKLQQENQQLQSQIKMAPNPTDQISPEDQIELHRIHTVNAMKQLGLAMRIYAADHNEQYATNFDQLKDMLNGVTNFPGNISLDDIEFMNVGLVNDTMPDKIMFRQRNPDKMISGAWMRVYGLGDGSVQTQYSGNGNFDAYEQQHMVLPPQNPSQ